MTGYYTGKIKVVGEDRMCFPADPLTLQALSCGCYDPFALSDPDPEPLETISLGEWSRRRAALAGQQPWKEGQCVGDKTAIGDKDANP